MLLAVLMKFIGFFREILISYYYGASYVSDAYLIALTIPGTVYTIIGTGLITGFIPMYSRIESERKVEAADRFTSNFINFSLLCCAFLMVLIYLFTRPIINLFAIGFEGEVLELTVRFTRIASISIFFTVVVAVYSGYLQIKKKFLLPALMSLPFNICIISSVILSYRYDNQFLAYGSVAAELVQFLFLIPIISQCGYRHRLFLKFDKDLRQTLRLSLPIIAGVSINQINVLVDKTIASQITEGGISSLNYASKLNGTIQAIFISSVVVVLFPAISKMAAEQKMEELKGYIQKAMIIIVLFILPLTVGMMIFARPIVMLLYGRGAFDAAAINLTSVSLFFYSIGMLGIGLREILTRAYYSLQSTRLPMINAIIGIVLNIILNLILSRFMGIAGLALATSISACITTTLLYIGLTRKIGTVVGKIGMITLWKAIMASLIMGLLARSFYNMLTTSFGQNRALLIAVFLGASVYFILIFCMKISYMEEFVAGMKGYLGSRKGLDAIYLRYRRRNRNGLASSTEMELLIGDSPERTYRDQRGVPYVGIVIVTYNNTDGLKRILEQIRYQSFHRYKVFIIDNGSTIDVQGHIGSYLEQNRNFAYYRLNTNLGRAGGFHYGIKLAYDHGASVIWGLEDNVIPHKYALEVLMNVIRSRRGKTCLISNGTDTFERDKVATICNRGPKLLTMTDFTFCGVLLPRNLVEEIGVPRKELYKCFDDVDYSHRAVENGYSIYRVRDSLLLCQDQKEEIRSVNLLHKSYSLPQRNKVDWYYYMRNHILIHKECKEEEMSRRERLRLLICILISVPNCFIAALTGLIDGRRGIMGRSEKYHD
jgi:putative peptidoglycan lipid II flippase